MNHKERKESGYEVTKNLLQNALTQQRSIAMITDCVSEGSYEVFYRGCTANVIHFAVLHSNNELTF